MKILLAVLTTFSFLACATTPKLPHTDVYSGCMDLDAELGCDNGSLRAFIWMLDPYACFTADTFYDFDFDIDPCTRTDRIGHAAADWAYQRLNHWVATGECIDPIEVFACDTDVLRMYLYYLNPGLCFIKKTYSDFSYQKWECHGKDILKRTLPVVPKAGAG